MGKFSSILFLQIDGVTSYIYANKLRQIWKTTDFWMKFTPKHL